jgi:hypothetical protein
MAQYGIIYTLQWNTVPSVMSSSLTIPAQEMIVNIYDTSVLIEDSQTPLIVELLADANPLVIRIINNDEDKFSPIRAKQATIQFKSDSLSFEDSLTFADASDNNFYVEITADGEFIFKGFLMLSDSQQLHLPDPNVVVLTASDHLALLKDIALVTEEGENPTGKYRIAQLISFCLRKTGLILDIVVINNLRHGGLEYISDVTFNSGTNTITGLTDTSFFYVGMLLIISDTAFNDMTTVVTNVTETVVTVASALTTDFQPDAKFTDSNSDGHFYEKVYLDSLTFEDSIGVSENCYTVLEKILGEDCFLTQWKGKWYIMRIDEYDGNPIYPATFNAFGVFQSFDTVTTFAKSVGANETRRLANADALRRYDRPHAYVRETFDFTYPAEIPCNVDYARGDETSDPDVQVTGYTAYELDCWDPRRLWGTALAAANFKAAILRSFDDLDREDQRFIMLTQPASPTGSFEYIRSSAIPVSFYDRFKWSFEAAAMSAPSGDGSILVCMIILYGVDGSVYVLRNSDITANWNQDSTDVNTVWRLSNVNVSLFRDGMQWGIYDDADHAPKTDWVNFTMEGAPVPVGGNVYIHLFSANQFAGTFDDFAIKYQNLSFEYYPYIGGTYRKYIKFHNKVTRDPIGYFNVNRDKTVYITDSPKPLFKGAMFIASGGTVLFDGTLTFAAPNSISTPLASGDYSTTFHAGMYILITGTNPGRYRILSVTYHVVPNNTEIIIDGTITTVTGSAMIYELSYVLTSRWYTAAPFALAAPPDTTYLHTYGYIQAFSVWNQYKNANRILSTSVLGLGSMWPDALDKWSITDTNPHVNNRYFLLISFEQNWKTCLWSGVFIEDYRTDIGKEYDDEFEFKYLTK